MREAIAYYREDRIFLEPVGDDQVLKEYEKFRSTAQLYTTDKLLAPSAEDPSERTDKTQLIGTMSEVAGVKLSWAQILEDWKSG